QRGLAGAIDADQPHDLPLGHAQVDVLQREVFVALGQPGQGECGGHAVDPPEASGVESDVSSASSCRNSSWEMPSRVAQTNMASKCCLTSARSRFVGRSEDSATNEPMPCRVTMI